MAYISNEYCCICDKKTPHLNHRCSDCSIREEKERIAKEDDRWGKLTIEEQLLELRQRIEKLEKLPDSPTYFA